MQGYWAYSCRSYFIGAVSGGECTVVNPLGQTVATSTNYYNYVTASINTDYCVAHLDGNRAKIEKLKSEYGPSVSVYDPGKLGSVLITSQTDAVSAQQMARKFEIEPLDSYFERSNPYNDR